MNQKPILPIAILILLILLGVGFFLYKYDPFNYQDNYHGVVYNKEAPNFTLTNQDGNKVTLSQFKDKVILIFFGYTHCPDICPLTLSVLKDVMRELGNLKDKVQFLFITVDPERDTVEKLKAYVPYFDETFLGLTASTQEIEKVARAYQVIYIKDYGDSKAGYLMTHTSSLYLIDQKGKLFLVYPHQKLDAKLIAKDIKRIL